MTSHVGRLVCHRTESRTFMLPPEHLIIYLFIFDWLLFTALCSSPTQKFTAILFFFRRNFFGKAFEQTVKNTKSRYLLDYWDSSLIQVRSKILKVVQACLKNQNKNPNQGCFVLATKLITNCSLHILIIPLITASWIYSIELVSSYEFFC